MKDVFSAQSNEYQKFRPTFPKGLVREIIGLVKYKHLAWDCGTGNGQIAVMLSPFFRKVIATDISENQVRDALQKDNIIYKIEPAENPSLENNSVDLIIVAQAVHWFDFDLFFSQVNRVLKKEGIIALLGYPLISVTPAIDKIIQHFYETILDGYWDIERTHVDKKYKAIPFPFSELMLNNYLMRYRWTLEQLIGFLMTWSAVQHFQRTRNENPVDFIKNDLVASWGDEEYRDVVFEPFGRVGVHL